MFGWAFVCYIETSFVFVVCSFANAISLKRLIWSDLLLLLRFAYIFQTLSISITVIYIYIYPLLIWLSHNYHIYSLFIIPRSHYQPPLQYQFLHYSYSYSFFKKNLVGVAHDYMNNRSKLPGTHCAASKAQISSICFCLLKLHYCTVELGLFTVRFDSVRFES